MQKAIKIILTEKPNSSNIDDCINKCLELYNSQTTHSITGYIPFFKEYKTSKNIDNVNNYKHLKTDKYLLIESG